MRRRSRIGDSIAAVVPARDARTDDRARGTATSLGARGGAEPATPSVLPSSVRETLASPGEPLDATARAAMEPRFGRDFSGVRVHADGPARESARSMNALAYTVGHDVVLGGAARTLGTDRGKLVLAHELAHVAQQSRDGAAAASPPRHQRLEREAGRAARAVVRGQSPVGPLSAAPLALARATENDLEDPKEILKQPDEEIDRALAPLDVDDPRTSKTEAAQPSAGALGEPSAGEAEKTQPRLSARLWSPEEGYDFVSGQRGFEHSLGVGPQADLPSIDKKYGVDPDPERIAELRTERDRLSGRVERYERKKEKAGAAAKGAGQASPSQSSERDKEHARDQERLKEIARELWERKWQPRHRRASVISGPGPGGPAGKSQITYAAIQIADPAGHVVYQDFATNRESVPSDPQELRERTAKEGWVHAEEAMLVKLREWVAQDPGRLKLLKGGIVQVVGDQKVCKEICGPALSDFAKLHELDEVRGISFHQIKKRSQEKPNLEHTDLHRSAKKPAVYMTHPKKAVPRERMAVREQVVYSTKVERHGTVTARRFATAPATDSPVGKGSAGSRGAVPPAVTPATAAPATPVTATKPAPHADTGPPRAAPPAPHVEAEPVQAAPTTPKPAPHADAEGVHVTPPTHVDPEAVHAAPATQKPVAPTTQTPVTHGEATPGHTTTTTKPPVTHAEGALAHVASAHPTQPTSAKVTKRLGQADMALGAIRDYQHYVEEYKKQGLSEEEAKLKASTRASVTLAANVKGGTAASIANAANAFQNAKASGQGTGEAAATAVGTVGGGLIADRVAPTGPAGAAVQLINTGAQVLGAPQGVQDTTYVAAELVPSSIVSTTITTGARSIYNLGVAAITGDASGIDKLGKDMEAGGTGPWIQGYAQWTGIAADMASGDSFGSAIEKAAKRGQNSWADRVGTQLGEMAFNLGQDKEAIAGKYGPGVGGLAIGLNMAATMARGESFSKAFKNAQGDMAEGQKVLKAKIAANVAHVKTAVKAKYDDAKAAVKDKYEHTKAAVKEQAAAATAKVEAVVEEAKAQAAEKWDGLKTKVHNQVDEARAAAASAYDATRAEARRLWDKIW